MVGKYLNIDENLKKITRNKLKNLEASSHLKVFPQGRQTMWPIFGSEPVSSLVRVNVSSNF